jgi:hypothetical protein
MPAPFTDRYVLKRQEAFRARAGVHESGVALETVHCPLPASTVITRQAAVKAQAASQHESGGAAASSYRLSSMKARPASHQLTPLPLTYDSNEKT